jgi:adenylate kinase family enzyme
LKDETKRTGRADGAPKQAERAVFERVSVVGTSCSGKTTLATRLAKALNSTYVELDALHWEPDWVEAPDPVFRARVDQALPADGSWVVDGNYSMVRDLVWGRATAVVWLDYPFATVLWRALVRTTSRVITKQKLYSGNVESLRQSFLSRDSILLWVIQTHSPNVRKYETLSRDPRYESLHFERCRRPTDAEALARRLESKPHSP